MPKSPEDMAEAMKAGILQKTGQPFEHWLRIVQASNLVKHGERMKLLKNEHGLTHGYANFICQGASGRLDAKDDDLLAGQYKGKEALQPIYDVLAAFATSLGSDVELAPKKSSVAFRRSKNFAVVTPATKTRVDLGLNLKGCEGTDRLKSEKAGAMCTHKVGLTSLADVDDEVKAWLREAYDRA